jgi:hypothetical protein
VLKLRLPWRTKLGLAGVFGMGLAYVFPVTCLVVSRVRRRANAPQSVCATGALRVHYAHRVYYYTKIHPSPTYDITWEALGSWVATAVETNVALICASAPALNVYARSWFGTQVYEERSFGWYGARGVQEELGTVGGIETVEGVALPCGVRRRSRRESGETMGRQDSSVPILKEG